jgi:hypothetical protein
MDAGSERKQPPLTARFCPSQFAYHHNMIWEKDGSSFEIRTQGELADGRPALDEVVAQRATIHLEQMSHDLWWMGLEAGGRYFY